MTTSRESNRTVVSAWTLGGAVAALFRPSDLLSVVGETIQPTHASLWLRSQGAPP